MGEVATSAEGMRSEAGTSAQGIRSQVGTSIRASIGNLVDSGAAPYSASAAFFLATTLVMVSVSVIRATTLLGIARSTLTAITLPWAATIRILARRINGGLVTNHRALAVMRRSRGVALIAGLGLCVRYRKVFWHFRRQGGVTSFPISARRATAPVGEMSLSGRRPIVLSTDAVRQVE